MDKAASPLQAILDFERQKNFPIGWINFAIRYSSPNGFWQRLEKGHIELDQAFFQGFSNDLQSPDAWRQFHVDQDKPGNFSERANPTQLGDHTSLKAETAEQNESKPKSSKPRPSLSKLAKDSTIGDPVSLESEEVVESDKRSDQKRPTSLTQDGGHSGTSSKGTDISASGPPRVDGEALFWSMMSAAQQLDPYIFPAVERLLQQSSRPIVGALSNNVRFPPEHPWSKGKNTGSGSGRSVMDLDDVFDIYISSSKEGMRKPSREMYELALDRLQDFGQKKGQKASIQAGEVIFLDDIGENLKAAEQLGMRTIKVQLGKTWRAVKELEKVLGIALMDEKTRRAKL